MEEKLLLGKTLESVRIFRSEPVHPAWADESTPAINSPFVYLQFSNGEKYEITPTEVELFSGHYACLGLAVKEIFSSIAIFEWPNGSALNTVELEELKNFLPQKITKVEVSDPLQEGAESQLCFLLNNQSSICISHIMPPMTLGISVASHEST